MTLYLRRVARTCIFAVQVGTALIVPIRSPRQEAHVLITSYLFPVLQNCKDLSIKHNIDLVSTEYPRPQNSTWLEKVKRIFQTVKKKSMHVSKLNDCLFDLSYLTLAFEVDKINSDVDVVKI